VTIPELGEVQFHGNSVRSWLASVRPATMRASTSVSQAIGSTPFNFAVWIRVIAIQGMRSDGALYRVQIHLDAAVIEERDQTGPVAERGAHGLCQIGRTRYLIDMDMQPVMQRLDDRSTSLQLNPSPTLGGLAADRGLDRKERGNARQHLER
jgi:hypothetical protein